MICPEFNCCCLAHWLHTHITINHSCKQCSFHFRTVTSSSTFILDHCTRSNSQWCICIVPLILRGLQDVMRLMIILTGRYLSGANYIIGLQIIICQTDRQWAWWELLTYITSKKDYTLWDKKKRKKVSLILWVLFLRPTYIHNICWE